MVGKLRMPTARSAAHGRRCDPAWDRVGLPAFSIVPRLRTLPAKGAIASRRDRPLAGYIGISARGAGRAGPESAVLGTQVGDGQHPSEAGFTVQTGGQH